MQRQMLTLPSPLSALGISHGTVIFLFYIDKHVVPGPASSLGCKMTTDSLYVCQLYISRKENLHVTSNNFQVYVNGTLAFSIKNGGLMYSNISNAATVSFDFIYESLHVATEDNLTMLHDPRRRCHPAPQSSPPSRQPEPSSSPPSLNIFVIDEHLNPLHRAYSSLTS